MVAVFGRRGFLKAAGASAAGGVVLGTTPDVIAQAAAPAPQDPPIGIIFLDYTQQFGISDFHAVGSGVHVVVTTGAALIYCDSTGGFLTTTIDVEPDATLDSVTVHAKGTGGPLTVEVWQQDFTASANYGKFVGNAPVAQATGAANAQTITASLAVGTPSGANTQFQLRVMGATSAYALSHATANYQPYPKTPPAAGPAGPAGPAGAAGPAGPVSAGSGFHPVGPARVYDSRDPGSGGPLGGGQTRDVSIANATAFSGGAVNVVPDGARVVTYNLTATDSVGNGFLAIYADGGSLQASALNWTNGEDIANGGVVSCSTGRVVTVEAGGGGSCNFIIDITGYYA